MANLPTGKALSGFFNSDAAGSVWDAVTSPFTRLLGKAIDPATYPDPAPWDEGMLGRQPIGPLSNLYHGTFYPEDITPGSSPKTTYNYASERYIDTPGKYTFASPDYNVAGNFAGDFGDRTVLHGQVDTESFNKGLYTHPYEGYKTVPGVLSTYDLREPQVLLKSQDAYDVLKGGKVGSVVPRYDFGPLRGIVSPDEMMTDIPKESVTYLGDDVPLYETRRNLEKAILPLKKTAGIAAKFANRLNPYAALAATVDNVRRENYLGAGGSALSILPGLPGLAGAGLDLASNIDYIRDAGAPDTAMPGSTYVADPNYDAQAIQSEVNANRYGSEGYYPRTGTPIGTSLLSGEVGNVKEMFFPPDFDTTRTYGWNNPDLNDIIANTYLNGIHPKLRRDLSNDPAHIDRLKELIPLNPTQSWSGYDPSGSAPEVTTDDIDNLASILQGGGYQGRIVKTLADLENNINRIREQGQGDIENFRSADTGFRQDVLTQRGLDHDPFNLLYETGKNLPPYQIDKRSPGYLSDMDAERQSINFSGPVQDALRAESVEDPAPTDWRSILGIDPDTGFTAREILGIREPGQRAPARRFNRDEFGNVASLARFTEPEVDTDDFIRDNLIEAISPVVSKPKPQPEQDDSNARQAREAAAKVAESKVTKKKKSTAALIADTKKKSKTVTAAKVTAAKAQDRTDSLVSRIMAESGKSRNNLNHDDKKTIARSQSTADRKKKEVQEAARAANIAREKSLERAMGSKNYSAYQARGRR